MSDIDISGLSRDEMLQLMLKLEKEIEKKRLKMIAEYNVPLSEREAGMIMHALREYKERNSFGPDTEHIIPSLLHKIDHYVFPGMGG